MGCWGMLLLWVAELMLGSVLPSGIFFGSRGVSPISCVSFVIDYLHCKISNSGGMLSWKGKEDKTEVCSRDKSVPCVLGA